MAAAFPAFRWQSFCHLPAWEGQFLNEVTESLLGCLCKTAVPQSTGWREWKQNSLGEWKLLWAGATSVKCSQRVNEAMTSSHFIHPGAKPRVKRFTSSCISVQSKCRQPLGEEPEHEVKGETCCYLNGVEVIVIITIRVIANIHWAHALCHELL